MGSFHVPTKHEAKHRYLTWKLLLLCFIVSTWEDTTKHLVSFTSFNMSVYCIFCLSARAPLLFSASCDVSNELQLSGLHVRHNNAVEHCIWSISRSVWSETTLSYCFWSTSSFLLISAVGMFVKLNKTHQKKQKANLSAGNERESISEVWLCYKHLRVHVMQGAKTVP